MKNKKLFEERLGAKTAVERGRGHFSGSDGVKEIPVVLEKLLYFFNEKESQGK